MARKEKYSTYVKPYLDKIIEWISEGENEYNIANKLGVHPDSFVEYKKKYSELSESIMAGKQNLLLTLRKSLYKKANGFEYIETRREVKRGDQAYKKVTRIKKYVVPDTQALIFALTNLDSKNWKRIEKDSDIENKFPDININLIGDDED
jgi:hypothetical protein